MLILDSRQGADPNDAYVRRLYDRGLDTILKRVGEEAVETIIAARGDDPEAAIRETANLMVLLARDACQARAAPG